MCPAWGMGASPSPGPQSGAGGDRQVSVCDADVQGIPWSIPASCGCWGGPPAAAGASQALSLETEERIPPRGATGAPDGPGAAAGAGPGAGAMLRPGVLP